ncbi:MAG: PolC-type DNA polymerase III [Candidatus Woesearchaeota archaeon]
MDVAIVDIETTGLSADRHAITEIAGVRVRDGEVVKEFHSLVNPGCHIPSYITALTGISDDMVKDAPRIDAVMPSFLDFLEDSVFVGHNASFDFRFLDTYARKCCGRSLINRRLCTRKLANRLLPHLSSKKLEMLCHYFSITNAQAHRAMADVHATRAVFEKFLHYLSLKEISTIEGLFALERLSPKKCCSYVISLE